MAAQDRATPCRPGRGGAALQRRLGGDFTVRTARLLDGESDLPFRHASLALGELGLHTLCLPACRLQLSGETGPCLALPLAGDITLRPERRGSRPLAADGGHSAVLLPSGPFLLRCEGWIEVVLIALSRPALEAAVEQGLASPLPPPLQSRLDARLERGIQWQVTEPLGEPLLGLLHQTVRLLENGARASGPAGQLPSAALRDCLLRPLALLLLQDISGSGHTTEQRNASHSLDPLLAHIAANLERPLCLRELCELSGCSARTLQYAFERRFGCGPMQWVRLQRLEAAAQALRQRGGQEPIRQIARRCGYTNLSSFSRDIQRRFGRPPSALRRSSQ